MVRGLRSERYYNILIEDCIIKIAEQHFGEKIYTVGRWGLIGRSKIKSQRNKSGAQREKSRFLILN